MATRFEPVMIKPGKRPDPESVRNMIMWGAIFDSLWMAPYIEGKGSAGNMGFRSLNGICVTASGGRLGLLTPGDIMTIVDIKEEKSRVLVYFYGDSAKRPTQEALIYWDIFKKRKDVNVILHGHDLFVLENSPEACKAFPKEIAATGSVAEPGSPELRRQIADATSGKATYILAKGHGFFALGADFDEAGRMALKVRQAVTSLLMGAEYMEGLKKKYEIA